ncbi:unnamed protein product, partial [Meganyctiphanes norvegica]
YASPYSKKYPRCNEYDYLYFYLGINYFYACLTSIFRATLNVLLFLPYYIGIVVIKLITKYLCFVFLHAKVFYYKMSLSLHKHLHPGEKALYCPNCGYKMLRKNWFKMHIANHTGKITNPCTECELKSDHIFGKNILTGDEALLCPKCEHKCLHRYDLNHHVIYHTSEKPNVSSECDYKCKQYSCTKRDYPTSSNPIVNKIKSHTKFHPAKRNSIWRKIQRRQRGHKEHKPKCLIGNILFIVFMIFLCYTFIVSINEELSQRILPQPNTKSFQLPHSIHFKFLFSFHRSKIQSYPNTSPKTRKTILLLLLICGDNSAAINPGPYSLPMQNSCSGCDGALVRYNTLNKTWHCTNCDTINYTPHSPISPLPLSNAFDPLSPLQSSLNFIPLTLYASTPVPIYNCPNPPFPLNEEHILSSTQSQYLNAPHVTRTSINANIPTDLSINSSYSLQTSAHLSPVYTQPTSQSTTTSHDLPSVHTSQSSSFNISERSLFTNKSHLRLLNINCRSILSKNSSIKHLLITYDPDIIVATETWLNSDISSSEFFPKEFHMTCYRNNRDSRGGGVLIATKPGLVVTPVPKLQSQCEITSVKI